MSASLLAASARALNHTHTLQYTALQSCIARSLTTHSTPRTMFRGCFSKDSDAVSVPGQPKKAASSAAASGKKLHLVLLGAPGVGKGVQLQPNLMFK